MHGMRPKNAARCEKKCQKTSKLPPLKVWYFHTPDATTTSVQ